MKVDVVIHGEQAKLARGWGAHDAALELVAPRACTQCGAMPLRVAGRGKRVGGHDYYEAAAHCAACGECLGVIRAYVNTIFGLEEDERVLHGMARVY